MSNKSEKTSEEKPIIAVNKWDGSAVKNALDDAVKDVLIKKYNYTECFRLMDGRLLICGIAVSVAMFALLWDHLYPFPQSRPVLIMCVTTYFLMMGILTLYTTYKEKGIFAVAKKDHIVWEASSYLKKYDDMYNLVLQYKDTKTGVTRSEQFNKSVANYFDETGLLLPDLVENDVSRLHNSILAEKKKE
ncbi:probable signal peptidase complex subunit 2 [Diaphorina citri]|uniref:Signal peptidase complex subunit 2 n=1 Tax=Diaphorina citri TaxID=121845 RepID=A0A1S3D4N2_DIACI|nr:probable signal peptidase complex subunit 2 [Diaphorina citri]KAI5705482.1 hypothetical protein M8J75_015459 [Diaphorina citri]KAI5737789.1 hypothetical protein M8J76_016850 [Diaphorina citri]KAI5743544.1 hypothetical protein M8J77_019409 [Diaphorina citri]